MNCLGGESVDIDIELYSYRRGCFATVATDTDTVSLGLIDESFSW